MSGDVLREAARLMRERAEAVDGWYTPAAWATTAPMNLPIERADAQHIASWPPAMAFHVAHVLDALATRAEPISETHVHNLSGYTEALTLARAYLGSAS